MKNQWLVLAGRGRSASRLAKHEADLASRLLSLPFEPLQTFEVQVRLQSNMCHLSL